MRFDTLKSAVVGPDQLAAETNFRARLAQMQKRRHSILGKSKVHGSRYLERARFALEQGCAECIKCRRPITRGYDLLTRRSELVVLQTSDSEFREDDTLRVLIRRSKADPFGMGRIAFSSKRSADLISAWLAWRGPDIAPLFCGIYQGKPIRAVFDQSGSYPHDVK